MKIFSALRKKKVERDFYLSLILKPHKVAAILFEKTENSLVIISTKEQTLEKELDLLTGEELVLAADTVISSVEGALPEGELVKNTIFAVPYAWQEEGKIAKENLLKLKEVCDALDLKAIGFLVTIEAVVNSMQKREGIPTTAIFIELISHRVFAYLAKAGNIVEVKQAELGTDVVKTVEELLASMEKADTFPSKIILQDYENAEHIQQEFLNHEWKENLNFIHEPQVLILEKGFENEAVINGVASQMGFDVLHDLKPGAEVVDEDVDASDEESNFSEDELASADEFGFVQGKDISQDAEEVDAVVESDLVDNNTEEELNPVIDMSEHANVAPPTINNSFANSEEDSQEQHMSAEKTNTDPGQEESLGEDTRTTLVDKVKSLPVVALIERLRGNGVGALLKKGMVVRIGIFGVGLAAVLVVAGYVYYSFFLKAEIVIFADSKVLSSKEEVTLTSSKGTSYEDKLIKLNTVSESVGSEVSGEVTGVKETGEKAKGEVIVYNKSEKPITFEKGTKIASSNGLEFVTMDEVKIASTSSFSTSFSSAKTKIEAAEFGKEYNLPSGTNFTVAGASTAQFFAKNESAFSGGSKKELKVVSKKDLTALDEKIQKGTQEKAFAEASKNQGSDVVLIKTPLSVELKDKKYSHEEGDEAKNVSLTAKVVYTFGVYAKDDLVEFAKQMAGDEVPDEYRYIADHSDVFVEDVKVDEGTVTGNVAINSVFAPSIETSKIMSSLKGKRVSEAESMLKEIKGASDYKVIRRNVLPLFPALLPFNTKNITVVVKTDG